jgi:tripartite-type tricarboxylate transporter receptor subunit TctC
MIKVRDLISYTLTGVLMASTGIISKSSTAGKFPTKPIRVIVPTGPGGSTDVTSRLVASVVHQYLGQPMIIQLKGGAGGSIGMAATMAEKADGYTLVFGTGNHTSIVPHVRNVPYDSLNDFIPVFKVNNDPYMIVALPNRYKTFNDLIKDMKANPGKRSYASNGLYGNGHSMILKIELDKGVKFKHVPFKGGGPAMRAMLGGHVDTSGGLFATAGTLSNYKKGKVAILAVAAAKRDPLAPDVPTFREQGVDFVYQLWRGFLAKKGTPQDRIDIIVDALYKTMKDKTFKRMMKAVGSPPNPLHGKAYKDMILAEHKQFGKIFQQVGVKKK